MEEETQTVSAGGLPAQEDQGIPKWDGPTENVTVIAAGTHDPATAEGMAFSPNSRNRADDLTVLILKGTTHDRLTMTGVDSDLLVAAPGEDHATVTDHP